MKPRNKEKFISYVNSNINYLKLVQFGECGYRLSKQCFRKCNSRVNIKAHLR